ncbi:MAG: methionyl-tRNA formyltransferase [Planctomycetota bacterium]|nr:methionyl-tRNA formyltransferase [Planctomycetota bacterium]
MRIGFFGSGAFGLPTLGELSANHEITFVVSQPDRPAGRQRHLRETPVSAHALEHGMELLRPTTLDDTIIETIRSRPVDAWVVIAYGLKLPPSLLQDRFACNLHGSLLPRWRGAAPIQRCLMSGDPVTGVSVITLAEVMDAGEVLASAETTVDPTETAGELHDRLAALGPAVVLNTLASLETGGLQPRAQDESAVTLAPKLTRAEATVDFDQPASRVRGCIHGLTPWPGCDVQVGTGSLRLKRARDLEMPHDDPPGTILDSGHVACGQAGGGALEILEVQPAGGRPMSWKDWQRGHPLDPGARLCST